MHYNFRFELSQIRPRNGSMLAFDTQDFIASAFRLNGSLEEFRFIIEGPFKFYEPVDLHVKRADIVP